MGSNGLSPVISVRPGAEGDHAYLVRWPTISGSSVQPVVVRGWYEHAIGVHPEKCQPLNLDFDGDEVHLYFIVEPESITEHKAYRSKLAVSRFSARALVQYAGPFLGHGLGTACGHESAFVSTSLDVSTAASASPSHPAVAHLGRFGVKASSWALLGRYVGSREGPSSFVAKARQAISNMAASNLGVPSAHVISRKFAHYGSSIRVVPLGQGKVSAVRLS